MELSKKIENNIVIIGIAGDLNFSNGQKLFHYVIESIDSGYLKIILDLQNTAYMDSSGIAQIINLIKVLHSKNGGIRLINLSNSLDHVFKGLKMDKVFKIFNSEKEAIESF